MQHFAFDAWERLSQTWNNAYPSSSDSPLEQLDYQYADATHPAWVSVRKSLIGKEGLAQAYSLYFQAAMAPTLVAQT